MKEVPESYSDEEYSRHLAERSGFAYEGGRADRPALGSENSKGD
jgi:hypothetical protein